MKLLISGLIFLLMVVGIAGIANAVTVTDSSKLIIEKIDVKVGGKAQKGLVNGKTISKTGEPGDTVRLEVTVANNFTSEEKLDIDDIDVEATLVGIDDGEDDDKSDTISSLKPGRRKEVAFEFQIPVEVDIATYDIEFLIEGTDDNHTIHNKEAKLFLEVVKEKHDVKINKKSLSANEVSCSRKGIQLTAGVINTGDEDEEKVSMVISNRELGIDYKETFDIDSGAFDDEVKFVKTYTFDAPKDLPSGVYPINIVVSYDDNAKTVTDTVSLVVNDCQQAPPVVVTTTTTTTTVPPKSDEDSGDDSNIVDLILPRTGGIFPGTGASVADTTTTTQPSEDKVEETAEKGFFNSNWFVVFLIGAEVIVALLVIGLIVRLARK